MKFLLGLAIVAIMTLKVMTYAQAPTPLEMKKAEPLPTGDFLPVPLENEKSAADVKVPEDQIPVDTSNLIIYTAPNARIDIYDIHFVYRNPDANLSDGWTLYEKYMDAVAKPIISNARADKDGIYETQLKPGSYAVGACDKHHRLGSTYIIKIGENLEIKEIELRSWGSKNGDDTFGTH